VESTWILRNQIWIFRPNTLSWLGCDIISS
jgi:hypothetical protein